MVSKLQMSMNRGMNFFLGLQVKQAPQGTSLHQEKYTSEFLKKDSMKNYSSSKAPMSFRTKMLVDPFEELIDEKTY